MRSSKFSRKYKPKKPDRRALEAQAKLFARTPPKSGEKK